MQDCGTEYDPIVLSSDDEDDDRSGNASSHQQHLPRLSSTDEDYNSVAQYRSHDHNSSISQLVNTPLSTTLQSVYSQHSRAPRWEDEQVESLIHKNIVLRPGTDIKYADSEYELSSKPNFFHIKQITQDAEGKASLHGWDMRRNMNHQALLLGADNGQDHELHIIAELPLRYVDANVATTSITTCMELPAVCSVIKIIFSNVLDPLEDAEQYICRWIHINQKYHDSQDQFILRRLRAEDCLEAKWTVPDHVLRGKHRQAEDTDCTGRSRRHRRTNISACCGCGGDMTGAAKAGWITRIGIEKDADAVKTLQAQPAFVNVRIEEVPIDEYLNTDGDHSLVDHIWLSFPCQWCSPANRAGGSRDDENLAVSFAAFELIKRHRPRVVSVEQSYGLNDGRFAVLKAAFIRQFTDLGYSITYSTIDLRHFGNPLPRRRVIMIATCPGEKIIPMPKITHSSKNGLKAFVTPEEHLASCSSTRFAYHLHRTIGGPHGLDDKENKLGCAIASGSLPTHPNGRRRLWLWEFAALQTFGPEHVWPKELHPKVIKKQIGNAVPPMYAKIHFKNLDKHLSAEDERIEQLLEDQRWEVNNVVFG